MPATHPFAMVASMLVAHPPAAEQPGDPRIGAEPRPTGQRRRWLRRPRATTQPAVRPSPAVVVDPLPVAADLVIELPDALPALPAVPRQAGRHRVHQPFAPSHR